MKKLAIGIILFLCCHFCFSKGSVLTIKPIDFKDCITVYNETDSEMRVYVIILYKNNSKKYKSEIVNIKPYSHKDMDFNYDCEWHDLVKDVRKFFNTKDKNASAYDFEFHFSEEDIVLDETRTKTYITGNQFMSVAKHNSYEVFVKKTGDEGF